MRAELGLSSPERRIGQTAHDFAQAMGAQDVVITRAQKRGGSPTVPSRFLQRLAALAGAVQWSQCKARGERALALARLVDGDSEEGQRARRPTPRPRLALRPTSLSVTRIETLRRDPYSIYAERILNLKPMEPIGAEMGARLSGILLHDVLSGFVIDHPKGRLVPGAEAELIERARKAFDELMRNAAFRAFSWPRHCFALKQFIAWENERRDDIADIDTEQRGKLVLTLTDGSLFTLTGVADRIEHRTDGSLIVVDYKSGRVPSQKEVKAGFSPQLTLEAAMIERGGFEMVRAKKVSQALYVKIGGAAGVEDRVVKGDKDQSFEDLVQGQFEELNKLLSQFRDETTAYVPRPYPQFVNAYGAYDHLARVREWSAGGEGGE
jgi:ATP-dependent helicase/nuclease subunit B